MSPSPLPPWLTAAHLGALRRLVAALQSLSIPYVVTGGLAGNLHGSTWPLHDIDIDVPAVALPTLAAAFPGEVCRGPGRYVDSEFELDLLTLDLGGVLVDATAAESVVLRDPAGGRHAFPTDLGELEWRPLLDLALPVQPLRQLLAYKRRIGRAADVADLAALAAAGPSDGPA